MSLTGNELLFECEACGKEKFLDQLSMADLRCIGCIIEEQKSCLIAMSLPSTPVTSGTVSATSNTTRKKKWPMSKS